MQTKRPWQSKTVWGAVVMMAAFILSMTGTLQITEAEQAEMTDKIMGMVDEAGVALGFILTLWGRATASTSISMGKGG